ncbi:MAG: putative addiction module antidote protein [Alphaproteobacteria bacterium 32-64-14]|nr:MAG: putative addiction module antidote protein [Alphaproteobacteria bacterium 32-64-14]
MTYASPYDSTEFLDDDVAVTEYIEAALEENDPKFIAKALGIVARAKGMSEIARETGLSRESLYKALSADGNPEFATVLAVLRALKLRLSVAAAE